MPKSVKLFSMQQIECNHWASKYSTDKQRFKEINSAITKPRFKDLEKDEIKCTKNSSYVAISLSQLNWLKHLFKA